MSSRPTVAWSSAQRPGSPALAFISRGAPLPRRVSAGRSETLSAGLRPAARGPWFSPLASAFRGASLSWRIFAGPGGGITRRSPPGRWPPPSGARRRLGESPPVRAETSSVGLRPATQGPCWRVCADRERLRLSTCTHLGKIACLISSEVGRSPPLLPETPVGRSGAPPAWAVGDV